MEIPALIAGLKEEIRTIKQSIERLNTFIGPDGFNYYAEAVRHLERAVDYLEWRLAIGNQDGESGSMALPARRAGGLQTL